MQDFAQHPLACSGSARSGSVRAVAALGRKVNAIGGLALATAVSSMAHASPDLGVAEKQATNWTAIIMFGAFVRSLEDLRHGSGLRSLVRRGRRQAA